MVERFVKNLGKVLRTARIDQINWKRRLRQFLRNYRATPHATTKIAPNKLLYRNADTSRLPHFIFKPNSIDKQAILNVQIGKTKIVDIKGNFFIDTNMNLLTDISKRTCNIIHNLITKKISYINYYFFNLAIIKMSKEIFNSNSIGKYFDKKVYLYL